MSDSVMKKIKLHLRRHVVQGARALHRARVPVLRDSKVGQARVQAARARAQQHVFRLDVTVRYALSSQISALNHNWLHL